MGFLDDHKTLAIATVAATGGALALWTISSHRRRQWPTPATTDFDSFLRKPIDNPSLQHQQHKKKKNNYAATSFEAYLTKNESSSSQLLKTGNDETAANIVEAAPCCCPPDAKPVTIFYGTEFGFSREIAEKLCHSIENYTTSNVNSDNKYWPELLNLADFPDGVSCLDRCQVVLLACSTQGDGVPPTEVRDFCSWLSGPTAPKLSSLPSSSISLTTTPPSTSGGVKFSVLALGDRSYTHFARCGKTIDARLEELGGQRFLPRVDVNKEDMVVVDAWIKSVVAELDNLNLQTAESLGWNGVRASLFNTLDSTTSTNGIASETKWSKSKPYFASVNKVESLCNLTNSSATTTATTPNGNNNLGKNTNNNFSTNINDKNTVRVEIDLGSSGIEYLPGDALGVWPKNDPQDAEDLLDAAGFSYSQMMMTHNNELISDSSGSIEKVMVKVPVWHYKDEEISNNVHGGDYNSFSSSSSSTAINGGLISLREALTRCYDLKTPKPELMQLLAKKLAVLKQKYKEEDTPSLANNSRCGNGNGILSGESDVQRNTHSTIITNGTTNSSHFEDCINSTTTIAPVNSNVDRLSSLLKELTNNKDLLEKYLSARHIADILRDWKPATLTVEELLSVLRQLQPRLYSISSSPLEDTSSSMVKENTGVGVGDGVGDGDNSGSDGSSEETQRPHTVQLTVAVLHYKSAVGKPRVGVASTYLAERAQEQQQQQQLAPSSPPMQEGQKQFVFQQNSSSQSRVPVYLYKNPDFRLPADLKTPIIMVGPGTGVAPFRGFIQHRILLAKAAAAAAAETERKEEKVQRLQNLPKDGHVEGTDEKHGEDKLLEKQEAAVGPALLFFGCRRRDEDYLYGTELESWANEGHIRLCTAFSRETDKKIYVQHRLVENGELVWQLLEAGAVFYVCGDGAHMAGDVESALKSIIEKYQGQGYAAAVQYFDTMVKTGHYKKDVWTS